jgi:hypothetical protein
MPAAASSPALEAPHPGRSEPRECSVPREPVHVEVHSATRQPVGAPSPEEPSGQRAHRPDLARGMRHDIGRAPSQRAHIGQKAALVSLTQGAPRLSVARRSLQDRFIDVGDVLHVADLPTSGFQMADEDVEEQKRPGVAEVRRVIGRDAAHVQGHRLPGDPEDGATCSPGIVEAQHADRRPSACSLISVSQAEPCCCGQGAGGQASAGWDLDRSPFDGSRHAI